MDCLQSPQTANSAPIQKWILSQDQMQGTDRKTCSKHYDEGATIQYFVKASERFDMGLHRNVQLHKELSKIPQASVIDPLCETTELLSILSVLL